MSNEVTHHLKIERQWADAKLSGVKPFEVRRNDRGFQKGDFVRYSVIDPKTGETDTMHKLGDVTFVIEYVLAGIPGLEQGYAVFSDRPAGAGEVK